MVTAYGFVVGKKECVKVIVGTYMAAVSIQAIIMLCARIEPEFMQLLRSLGFGISPDIFSSAKLVLFLCMMVLIAVRGGLDVQYAKENWQLTNIIVTGLFGIATAGLMVVSLITYLSAVPLLSPQLGMTPLLLPIIQQSTLLKILIHYQDIWFALPALLLLIVGFYDHTRS